MAMTSTSGMSRKPTIPSRNGTVAETKIEEQTMHTSKINETRFVHNGDFSGDIRVLVKPEQVQRLDVPMLGGSVVEMEIPFDDLKGIVFEYLRRRQIAALENMSDEDFEQYLT
jgi:hypothetical protein